MLWDEHNNIPVEVYEPGMFFGEFEVFKNTPRLFSCLALTDLEVLVLKKKDFKKIFFRSFPKLGNFFIQEMNFNFERLEHVMELIQTQMFPENSDSQIDEKLNLIRNEKNILSKLGSNKNSISGGTGTNEGIRRRNPHSIIRLSQSSQIIGQPDSVFSINSKILKQPRKLKNPEDSVGWRESNKKKSRFMAETKEDNFLNFMTNDHLISEVKESSSELRQSRETPNKPKEAKNVSIDVGSSKTNAEFEGPRRSRKITNRAFGEIELELKETDLRESKYDFSDRTKSISIPKTPKLSNLSIKEINKSGNRINTKQKIDQNTMNNFRKMSTLRGNKRRRVSLNLMGSKMFKNKFKNRKTFFRSIKKESTIYNNSKMDGNSKMEKKKKKESRMENNKNKEINFEKFEKEKMRLEKMLENLATQMDKLVRANKNY